MYVYIYMYICIHIWYIHLSSFTFLYLYLYLHQYLYPSIHMEYPPKNWENALSLDHNRKIWTKITNKQQNRAKMITNSTSRYIHLCKVIHIEKHICTSNVSKVSNLEASILYRPKIQISWLRGPECKCWNHTSQWMCKVYSLCIHSVNSLWRHFTEDLNGFTWLIHFTEDPCIALIWVNVLSVFSLQAQSEFT